MKGLATKAADIAGILVAEFGTVRESANKSAASAASGDYVKFQAVIKSAASAASLRGGRASGQKITKNNQNLGLCQACSSRSFLDREFNQPVIEVRLGPLQKNLDSEVPKLKAWSLRSLLDRE